MRIAGLQLDIAWEDPEANYARIRPWLATARAAGARMVVLPEMFPCGFSMAPDRVAEPEGGRSTAFLLEEAGKHGIHLAGSIPELPKGAARPSNTLLLAGPDGSLTRYRKIHPFTFAGEDRHYAAGDRHVTVSVEGLRLTLFVCYDLRFADEFWATASATDAYLVVANWPERRRHHWTALLQARAIENQAYVVGVNRVGEGDGLVYQGDSRVIDPGGEVVASAAGTETLILADLDPAVVAKARETFPFLRDRR
ncbi:MAG TPA: carbon-nitrogen family hydrolase [Vicinamibacteria bacterium]